MKYYVGIAVDGRVYVEVEAEAINAEDENGKFKDYKRRVI